MRLEKPDIGVEGRLDGCRVALFSGNYNYIRDGANQALNRLVAHLEKAGAQVRVYSPTTKRPAFEPAGKLVSVRSFALPGRREYRLATGLSRKIKEDIRAFDPHLVHLSAPDILGTKALTWSKTELQVPIIASLHTRFETYLDYYGLGMMRGWMDRHLADFYGRCDYVLVPNQHIQQEMSPDGSDPRIQIWGRGIDQNLFNPERRSHAWRQHMGYARDDVVLLFFGRLVLEKGIQRFAEIIRQLRYQGVHTRPLIVGDGPARDRFVQDLPNANFVGHLVGEDLAQAVASADILINPSQSEAFGNVNLEAMASGLAVIAADCPSSRNLIVSGKDGWLCDTENVQLCAKHIGVLIDSSDRRHSLGNAAARKAAQYHWDKVLDQVVDIYDAALEAVKFPKNRQRQFVPDTRRKPHAEIASAKIRTNG
jgi:glycosyltransferase involved in cell wall biosynthesis